MDIFTLQYGFCWTILIFLIFFEGNQFVVFFLVLFWFIVRLIFQKFWCGVDQSEDASRELFSAPHSHSIFLFQHLSHVRPVSIKDMEKFTSPWAVAAEDEEKFARTVSSVGRLLRDDLHLQVTR